MGWIVYREEEKRMFPATSRDGQLFVFATETSARDYCPDLGVVAPICARGLLSVMRQYGLRRIAREKIAKRGKTTQLSLEGF